MDFIKLTSSTSDPLALDAGEPINGYEKALWVERYNKAGEFKLEAPLSSGLDQFLPIGTLISHIGTQELMIVENHQITHKRDEDPWLVISGRSFIAFLEQRTLGEWFVAAGQDIVPQTYTQPAEDSWDQVVSIIQVHLTQPSDSGAHLPNVEVNSTCTGSGESEIRPLQQSDVYSQVVAVLKIDDVGIKCVRPTPTESSIYITVYQGADLTDSVRFSWMQGDVDNLEYLYSNKALKTEARVMGRWIQKQVNPGSDDGYDRRTLIVDAKDIDERYSDYPTGGNLTSVLNQMEVRGREALAKQNQVSIVQADVSETARARYRQDYNMGDLVSVHGDFGAVSTMRVVEFAESDEPGGSKALPTLAIPGEDL